jgi:hypothetical protein
MAAEVATITMHRSRSLGMLPGIPGQPQFPLTATAVPARLSPKPGNSGLPSVSENEAIDAAKKIMQKGAHFSMSARNLGDKLYGREATAAAFRPAVPPSLPSFKVLLKTAAEKLVLSILLFFSCILQSDFHKCSSLLSQNEVMSSRKLEAGNDVLSPRSNEKDTKRKRLLELAKAAAK